MSSRKKESTKKPKHEILNPEKLDEQDSAQSNIDQVYDQCNVLYKDIKTKNHLQDFQYINQQSSFLRPENRQLYSKSSFPSQTEQLHSTEKSVSTLNYASQHNLSSVKNGLHVLTFNMFRGNRDLEKYKLMIDKEGRLQREEAARRVEDYAMEISKREEELINLLKTEFGKSNSKYGGSCNESMDTGSQVVPRQQTNECNVNENYPPETSDATNIQPDGSNLSQGISNGLTKNDNVEVGIEAEGYTQSLQDNYLCSFYLLP